MLAAIVLSYLVATALTPAPPPAPVLESLPDRPLVIAHRGGRDLRPENTVTAFRHAHALGADMLELDVQLSADDELMVIHDTTVDRTTGGSGAVRDLTRAELQVLDAGWGYVDATGGTPWRGRGVVIPTLREVFEAVPDAAYVIELKPSDDGALAALGAPYLCRALRDAGLEQRAIVGSFQAEATEAFRAECPDVAVSAATPQVLRMLVLSTLRLDGPYVPRVDAYQIPPRQGPIRVLSPAFVRAARAKNRAVQVWTLNDASEIRAAFDVGADGVITDRPDVAMEVLGIPSGDVD